MLDATLPSSWPAPQPRVHAGRFVTLAPSEPGADAAELFAAGNESEAARRLWQFMPWGPFADAEAMRDWMRAWQRAPDVLAFTVTSLAAGRKVGMISLMQIRPAHGAAELGGIWYAPGAQRTKINTECVYLLLRHLFDDLRYRRAEWKCDDLNEPSKAAALRLGFQFEGLFRQHLVIKGRNRDTAWFAMLDGEWPRRKASLERWLYEDDSVSLGRLNAESGRPGGAGAAGPAAQKVTISSERTDRGRRSGVAAPPPSEPNRRVSRIRLSSQWGS
jgi:RimJ/RimL family protein N-acetyltransferase